MQMKSEEYWRKRFEILKEKQFENAEKYLDILAEEYKKAYLYIEEKIAKWYTRLSVNNEVSLAEAKKLLLDGRGEPLLALNGDIDLNGRESNSNDGLQIIRNLTRQAYSHLNPRGMFFIEAGEDNALKATEIFAKNGFIDIKVHNDLAKKPRVIEGRKP